MIVRVESPSVVSTWSTTTATGTSTGFWGAGRVGVGLRFWACVAGASVRRAVAAARNVRLRVVINDSIYMVLQFIHVFPTPVRPRDCSIEDDPERQPGRRNGKAAKENSSAALFRPDCSLLLQMELKRHLHELGNLLTPDLRRRESHTGERILHGGGKRRVARVENLE